MPIKQSSDRGERNKFQKRAKRKNLVIGETRTFVRVAQSVAFQCDFGFELFAAQITEVSFLGVVPVHVGLEVVPAAAGIVAQVAGIRLHTCTHGHKTFQGWETAPLVERFFFFSCQEKKKGG